MLFYTNFASIIIYGRTFASILFYKGKDDEIVTSDHSLKEFDESKQTEGNHKS